jgi:hypothetical protein
MSSQQEHYLAQKNLISFNRTQIRVNPVYSMKRKYKCKQPYYKMYNIGVSVEFYFMQETCPVYSK